MQKILGDVFKENNEALVWFTGARLLAYTDSYLRRFV